MLRLPQPRALERCFIEARVFTRQREQAERTAVAVLQALADRLTGDEADDLLAQLPEPLKRSVAVTPQPEQMTANAFVERVADELGLSPEEARERVRGVLDTIREAVTPGEFHDVLVQLPSGCAELLPA